MITTVKNHIPIRNKRIYIIKVERNTFYKYKKCRIELAIKNIVIKKVTLHSYLFAWQSEDSKHTEAKML